MPNLKGMNLTAAQALYTETVGDQGPKLEYINKVVESWPIVAPSMWDVCAQAPTPGKAVTAKTWTAVAVNKRGQC